MLTSYHNLSFLILLISFCQNVPAKPILHEKTEIDLPQNRQRRAIRLAELELQDKERKMYDEYLMKKLMAFYIEQRMRKLTAKRSAPLKPKLIIDLPELEPGFFYETY